MNLLINLHITKNIFLSKYLIAMLTKILLILLDISL